MSDIDHIRFLLGFPGIELGVGSNLWTLNVYTTCRNLIRKEDGAGRCAVFGQPERPKTCIVYDEQRCAYRQQFSKGRAHEYVRVRMSEFPILKDQVFFNDDGYVIKLPNWEELRTAIENRWHPQSAAPQL